MKNINHLVEMARQSHQHMPSLLSLFLGLMVIKPFGKNSRLYPERSRRIKKRSSVFFNENEITGDNIPATLMDGLEA